MIKRILSVIFHASVVALLFIAQSMANTTPLEKRQVAEQGIGEILNVLDPAMWDLDELIDRLDYESDSIIQFVKLNISYQPYGGLLRGPTRTLSSRAGNSLDQSVLLAKLLNDSGAEARVVSTPINSSIFSILLKSFTDSHSASTAKTPMPWQTDGEYKAGLTDAVNRLQPLVSDVAAPDIPLKDPVTDYNLVTRAIERIHDNLREELNDVTLQNNKESINNQIMSEIGAYYAVEYREAPSDEWQLIHPSVPGNETAIKFDDGNKKFYDGEIPDQHLHKIQFDLIVERNWAGQQESLSLMSWTRPVANISERNLTLQVASDAYFLNRSEDIASTETDISRFYIPTFDGSVIESKQGFDLKGNVFPLEEAFDPASGVFRTFGDKMDKAIDSLSNDSTNPDDSPTPVRYMSGLTLRITLIRPGRDNKTHMRKLAKWQGDFESLSQQFPFQVDFAIRTGAVSYEHALHRLGESALQLVNIANDGKIDAGRNLNGLIDLDMEMMFTFSGFFNLYFNVDRAYRSSPGVVARYRPLSASHLTHEGFDIIDNDKRLLKVKGHDVFYDREGNMLRGIVDTAVEGLLLPVAQANTLTAYDVLRDEQVREYTQLTMQPPNENATEPVLTDELRAFAEQENVALLAPQTNDSHTVVAAWVVDKSTGNTLGILNNGWGGIRVFRSPPGVTTTEKAVTDFVAIFEGQLAAKAARATIICSGIVSTALLGNVMVNNEVIGNSICDTMPIEISLLCNGFVSAVSALNLALLSAPVWLQASIANQLQRTVTSFMLNCIRFLTLTV